VKQRETPEERQLAERLRNAEVAPTRQRLRVLQELSREPNDATARVLYQRLSRRDPHIGLATVYRALRSFAEAGVIDVLPHSASEACYRLCTDSHHHHLVCSSCHRVVELDDCELDDWIERKTAAEGFLATNHRLEVVGLCATCRK
jgi:Fur family ferric uptake transcriptional regulator